MFFSYSEVFAQVPQTKRGDQDSFLKNIRAKKRNNDLQKARQQKRNSDTSDDWKIRIRNQSGEFNEEEGENRSDYEKDVTDVKISDKLIDSACCLVAPDSGMDVQMEKIMKMQNKDFKGMPRILEVNPNHSLMNHMSKILKSNQNEFDDLSKILLDQARLLEGHLPNDVSFYCKKINELILSLIHI